MSALILFNFIFSEIYLQFLYQIRLSICFLSYYFSQVQLALKISSIVIISSITLLIHNLNVSWLILVMKMAVEGLKLLHF